MIETRLAAAQEYIAKNENVESRSWLHLRDWEGKSGHPLWMKNFMIPATKRGRARKEKALAGIVRKNTDKRVTMRIRQPRHAEHRCGTANQ